MRSASVASVLSMTETRSSFSDMVGSGGRDSTAPDYHDQARTPFMVLAVQPRGSFQWDGWLAEGRA